MGPKKAAAAAAAAAAAEEIIASPPKASEKEVTDETKSDVAKGSGKTRKVSPHPTTMQMVKEALMELDSRKGVSAQAVRSFIKEKYPTVDEARLKGMVRKALVKGLESNAILRPANSATSTGVQGRFRLAVRKTKEAKPVKKSKEANENADPNVGKAKERKAKETGAEKAKPVKKAKATTEESKPKKAKKDDAGSKVAPAKKPKAKKAGRAEEEPKTQKRTKTTKGGSEGGDGQKAVTKKGGKKEAQKAGKSGNDGAETAEPKKGGKKTPQKTEDGENKPSKGEDGGGEKGAAAAPKGLGRKGKKAAES